MQDATRNIVSTLSSLPPGEKKEAIKDIREGNPGLFPTTDWAKVLLWALLIIGVLTVAVILTIGAIPIVAKDKDATALLVIVSAITAGLIGLFSKGPTQS
jgi:hypothetical protein